MNRESVRFWLSSRFGFLASQVFILLVLWMGLRLVLIAQFGREIPSATSWIAPLFVGMHLDIVAGWMLMLPGATLLLTSPERWFQTRWFRWILYLVNGLAWMVGIFLLLSEYYFFEEFRSRFNTVAIDYLLYPHEVFTNIWDTYPVPAILTICFFGAASVLWIARRVAFRLWEVPVGRTVRRAHLAAIWVGGGLLLATFSINETRFSSERLVNEIAGNGWVSVVSAAWSRNLDYHAFYPSLPKEEAAQRVRQLLEQPGASFESSPRDVSVSRKITGDPSKPKHNLVILLEESLGSEFWGCLGRKAESLTPEMDRLALQEGILFDNLYATGNRTVRGMEGVLSAFPPLPGDSIVKRDRSANIETVARVLKRDGYQSLFLYGGRGVFDGMRSYAVRNGYDRFIEQKDFPNPIFTTTWGVSDEELYQRTVEDLRDLHQKGEPFVVTVLSVSNHKPFTYPTGRIAEDPQERKRENAVKYCDWALGRFFEAAKKEAFWTNTLFAVVADHGARVYGSQTIPIRSYEVPMVLLGPTFVNSPQRVSTLASQVDVVPTLLGMLGRPYQSLFFGRDLFKEIPNERLVLVNHNRSVGAYRNQRLVVLSLNKKVEFFHGDPKAGQMQRRDQGEAEDLELLKDATAMFQVADELYMNYRFTLDGHQPKNAQP